MHFEAEQFETRLESRDDWSDNVFQFCQFRHMDLEGALVDSIFVGCTFEECEWYCSLFTCAVLVNVKFEKCKFRGTSFGSCKFVECEFHDCEFIKDNLNGDCSFNDVQWYNCIQKNCRGLEEEFRNKR